MEIQQPVQWKTKTEDEWYKIIVGQSLNEWLQEQKEKIMNKYK